MARRSGVTVPILYKNFVQVGEDVKAMIKDIFQKKKAI